MISNESQKALGFWLNMLMIIKNSKGQKRVVLQKEELTHFTFDAPKEHTRVVSINLNDDQTYAQTLPGLITNLGYDPNDCVEFYQKIFPVEAPNSVAFHLLYGLQIETDKDPVLSNNQIVVSPEEFKKVMLIGDHDLPSELLMMMAYPVVVENLEL
jgi:hypothetical protein